MRLRDYLSNKKLRRKSSQSQKDLRVSGAINQSFTDYHHGSFFLLPTADSMTHSMDGFTGNYRLIQGPENLINYQQSNDDNRQKICREKKEHLNNNNLPSGCAECNSKPDAVIYRRQTSLPCQLPTCGCQWQYHSLPTQTESRVNEVQYNSLPTSMTQSVYISSDSMSCSTKRSRIRTNPWLPLPATSQSDEFVPRSRQTDRRREPRLSRFISEVRHLLSLISKTEQLSAVVPKCPIKKLTLWEDSLHLTSGSETEGDSD